MLFIGLKLCENQHKCEFYLLFIGSASKLLHLSVHSPEPISSKYPSLLKSPFNSNLITPEVRKL